MHAEDSRPSPGVVHGGTHRNIIIVRDSQVDGHNEAAAQLKQLFVCVLGPKSKGRQNSRQRHKIDGQKLTTQETGRNAEMGNKTKQEPGRKTGLIYTNGWGNKETQVS